MIVGNNLIVGFSTLAYVFHVSEEDQAGGRSFLADDFEKHRPDFQGSRGVAARNWFLDSIVRYHAAIRSSDRENHVVT